MELFIQFLNTFINHRITSKLFISAVILIITLVAVKILKVVLNQWQKNFIDGLTKRDVASLSSAETRIVMIRKIINAAVYFFAFIFIFLQFDALKNIGTGLLASAGVAGIVIGMASQTTLSNIIAGISISFAQPIRLKDAVILDGEFGWIEEISLMHTIVKTWDNRRIMVPNNILVNKVVQNWTIKDPTLIGPIFMFVDYTCDVEKIRQWLKEIVDQSPHSTKEKVAVVHVVDFTEKSMQLRVLVKGPDAPKTWELRCEVREKLIKKFKEENLPLPQIRFNADNEMDLIKMKTTET